MVTIKSHTDLSQSKTLSKILPLESADMYYAGHRSIINPKEWEYRDTPNIRGKYISFDNKRIFYPCWSLAALLGVLHFPTLRYDIEDGEGGWIVSCEKNDKGYLSYYRDNPIDTCYEMILKLHEQNLL